MKAKARTSSQPAEAPAAETGAEPRRDAAAGVVVAVVLAGVLWLAMIGLYVVTR